MTTLTYCNLLSVEMSGIKSIIDLINKQNVLVLGSLVAKCLKIPNLRKSCWSVYLGIHILFLWIWGAWSRSLNIWAASKKTFTFARSWFAWFGRRYTSYYTAGILTNKPRQRVISDWTEGGKKRKKRNIPFISPNARNDLFRTENDQLQKNTNGLVMLLFRGPVCFSTFL